MDAGLVETMRAGVDCWSNYNKLMFHPPWSNGNQALSSPFHRTVLPVLSNSQSLKDLEMRDDFVNSEVALLIRKLLIQTTTLQNLKLDFGDNQNPEGLIPWFRTLSEGLRVNTTLKSLGMDIQCDAAFEDLADSKSRTSA